MGDKKVFKNIIEIIIAALLIAISIIVMLYGIKIYDKEMPSKLVVDASEEYYNFSATIGSIFKYAGLFSAIISGILFVYKIIELLTLIVDISVNKNGNGGKKDVVSEDLDDKLNKMKALVDQGLITQEEFDKFRQKAVEDFIKNQ